MMRSNSLTYSVSVRPSTSKAIAPPAGAEIFVRSNRLTPISERVAMMEPPSAWARMGQSADLAIVRSVLCFLVMGLGFG